MSDHSAPPPTASLPTDPSLTTALIEKHGILPEEFERIQSILGREPTFTELGVFSVMWSEHCSYKNSKLELKKFPTRGERILIPAGEENAGVVDIGDGWAIAFKMESHNHPSAVEPFQGAATGVGGIIRDIFTMGARPVFLLNSLRFGPIHASEQMDFDRLKNNRRLFAGVVSGISHYGNCIGIPTIGGEVYFDESYEGNPLVNVLCLGLLRHEQIERGSASGIGNPVFYVGAETGRDGLAGAAFASRELTEESKEDRPAVQVGDPFREKLLLEACLELFAIEGCVAGVQDMGAAGLTCSTCETASRGGTGVEIDLALVPMREPGMTPYEILLSESQERMLIIANRGREQDLERVFDKWDLAYAKIGEVKGDGMMRVLMRGQTVAEIPAKQLAEDSPVYEREAQAQLLLTLDFYALPSADPHEVLPKLLAHPSIASKNWVYRQYDHTVQTGTVVLPGSDAAVFYVRQADKYLAATTDCNAIYCQLDPREGGRLAVAEAARNLACSGAQPLAVTDNLNFGNPYKPNIFWQLREAVEGMAEACRYFGAPVIGGNVSLYNESKLGAIDPTPTVGMVGIIEEEAHITTQFFKNAGDAIFLLGTRGNEMGGSHFLKVLHSKKAGMPPRAELERELRIHDVLRALIRRGWVHSAHDCSEGGFAVALAECCFGSVGEGAIPSLGAHVTFQDCDLPAETLLFNETQGRVIISTRPEHEECVAQFLSGQSVAFEKIGATGGPSLSITVNDKRFSWEISQLHQIWHNTIAEVMAK